MTVLRRACQKCVSSMSRNVRLQHTTAYEVDTIISGDVTERKGCLLTNTVIYNGAPDVVKSMSGILHSDSRKELLERVENVMLHSRVDQCEATSNPKEASNIVDYKSKMSAEMLKNLMKSMWSSEYARISGLRDTTLSSRQEHVVEWGKFNRKVSNKNEHLISGKEMLPLFSENCMEESAQIEGVKWANLITDTLKLKNLPNSHGTESDESPYPCPQKLLSVNNFHWSVRMNQGLFYNFAQALTFALKNGAVVGEDLKDPIPMQFVTFNGTSFYFVWYQMNTLNINLRESTKSLKNIAWVKEMKLCDRITAKIPDTDYSVAYTGGETISRVKSVNGQSDIVVEGFNQEAAEMFTKFMLYPITTVQ